MNQGMLKTRPAVSAQQLVAKLLFNVVHEADQTQVYVWKQENSIPSSAVQGLST